MKLTNLAKKITAFAVIMFTLFALVSTSVAFASTSQGKANLPMGDLVEDGKTVGFRFFSSSYFGMSAIGLNVYVYSSQVGYQDDRAQTVGQLIDTFAKSVSQAVDPQAYYYDDKDANGNPVLPSGVTSSDLYRFNFAKHGETLQISKVTYDMLQLAKQMYNETDGAYNPASYRLVDLWGFSSRINLGSIIRNGSLPYDREWNQDWALPLPEQKYIDAFKNLADFDTVEFFEQNGNYYVTKNCPDQVVDGVSYSQWIDLGGVAKGYIVDGIREILATNGFDYYFINCGDSSIALTTYEDGSPLEIGLSSHHVSVWGGQPYASLKLSNVSISTSGLYIRNYAYDGEVYSHIIDCKTGRPVNSDVQVLTLTSKLDSNSYASQADCWTTALLVRGKDNLIAFLNNQQYTNKFDVSALSTSSGSDQIVTNIPQENFSKIYDDFVMATEVSIENGKKIVIYNENAGVTNPTKMVVLIVLACCGGALVIYIVIRTVRRRRVPASQKVAQVKADKLFKTPDIIIYALVLLLIVVLFGSFFGGSKDTPETIKIKSFSGHTLFTYNVATNQYYETENQQFAISTQQEGDTITVTVTSKDNDDFNVVQITKEDGKIVAKVVDSNCGMHQECVKYFPPITTKKGTIICNPHGIKVVADDAGNDYILI